MPHHWTRRTFLRGLSAAPLAVSALKRPPSADVTTFYVGTYADGASQGIYRCTIEAASGTLEVVEATGGIANPSFLALHPTENFLYAVSETTSFGGTDGGGVYAFSIDPESRALTPLNAQPSRGGAPCYVSVTPDGGFVLVANYVGGNVAILPILDDGSLGAASDVEQHEGSGPNEDRQEAPHAHFVAPDPSGTRAVAVDLGIDQVVIYRLDGGNLTRAGSASVHPGAGPRHLAFHPDGSRAYVINELDSTVTMFSYDDDAMTPATTVSTLPDDFSGESFCADIHVSANGRFVYGSNRGHDSIVVFASDGLGLTPIQHIPTGGSWPRNFAIDPSGRFLLVANQRSDNLVVFALDSATGRLEATGETQSIPSPVCVRFRAHQA